MPDEMASGIDETRNPAKLTREEEKNKTECDVWDPHQGYLNYRVEESRPTSEVLDDEIAMR
jgi:hypothetical protein